jgi:F-type H+-transporting ATPase subunit delta
MRDALSDHYAQALADAVFTQGAGLAPEQAIKQLNAAADLLHSSDELKLILMSPAVPRKKKTQIVGQLLEEQGVHRLIRNFLMVIVEHRRIGELPRIQSSFEEAIDKRQGFMRAEIVSAYELTDVQRQELLHALGTKAGKFIRPVYKVDRNILGGVIARLGSKEYDGSLTGRLEAMRRRLTPAT